MKHQLFEALNDQTIQFSNDLMTRTKENLNKFLSKALKTKIKQDEGLWETKTHSRTQEGPIGTKLIREEITKRKLFASNQDHSRC